jgi:hypothetical protein
MRSMPQTLRLVVCNVAELSGVDMVEGNIKLEIYAGYWT